MEEADLFLQRCEDSSGYFCCIGDNTKSYNTTVGIRPTNKHFCTETTVLYKTPRAKRPSKRPKRRGGAGIGKRKRERYTVRKRGGTVGKGGREEIEIQLASHPNTTFLSVPGNLRPSANQRAPFGLSIRSSAPTSVPPMLCGEVLFRPPAPGLTPHPVPFALSVRSGAKNWS
ncbi:hypothetical protein CDAR_43211 [Caerostris darwini]|uniref:Uncharacterized protein n=1 Tax=Caerostris darwini TaxID=1538125 RepID=A0AAV4WGV6_9ARAC|nr:hypothetical protein CDAR_43211 [Caerostris darwini]